MTSPIPTLAKRAFQAAALSQFGAAGAGLFLAGSAVISKWIAESDLGKAVGDVAAGFLSDQAKHLLGCAARGFREGRNGDIEASMHAAVQRALADLAPGAPGFQDWFEDWKTYLTATPASAIFTGAGDVDPIALQFDDAQILDLWWSRMEPTLARWREAARSPVTALHIGGQDRLDPRLAAFLRERLPAALAQAHDEVLRDDERKRSWIAYQQHVYKTIFGELRTIALDVKKMSKQLDRMEAKIAPPPPQRVWSVPLPVQPFTDRPEIVAKIDEAFTRGHVTALTALHGLGGIGKSQMARRYAQIYEGRYQAGVWIDAETDLSIVSSLSRLAPSFGIPLQQDQQQMSMQVLNAISARRPWLAIFDNATTPEAVRGYVRLLSGEGHVLLTSRNQRWDGLAAPVSVTRWDIDVSAKFLLDRTGQDDEPSARELAQELDGLVLALEHAASYMVSGDGTPLTEYRKIWRAKLRHRPAGHDYPDSVAATLELSLERVAQELPRAYDVLCLFAWLAPEEIPVKELGEHLRKRFDGAAAWNECVDALTHYSLVTRVKKDGLVTGYLVHRVVQEVVRERMTAEQRDAWFAVACLVVNAAFPYKIDDLSSWPGSAALLPHVRRIREHSQERGGAPEVFGRLMNEAGLFLQERGLYAEARQFLQQALESGLRQFGPDHPTVATHRSNLASILGDLGEHAAAREQIELALESGLRQFGPDHPTVATYRSNLASILGDLGEHAAAREQIELALESKLRQFGPDHPTVAIDRSNLAIILRDLGEHAAAREQIELALASALRQFGPDHPTVATRRSNLANILGELGEHAAAREQIELALESDLRQFGPDHPNVAIGRSNLANVLGKLGEHAAAREQIELALESALRQFGPDHPNVAIRRSNLANILGDLGEHDAAREQIELALKSELRQFGPDHPTVAISRLNLAAILYSQGDFPAALREIDQALDIFRRKLPSNHPHTRNAEAWRQGILDAMR